MLKKFEILEHKADLKIRAFGKDLRELFLNAIVGMFEGAGYESEGEEIKREIKISSFDKSYCATEKLAKFLIICYFKKKSLWFFKILK